MQRCWHHSTDVTQVSFIRSQALYSGWLQVVLILNFFQVSEAPGMSLCKYYFSYWPVKPTSSGSRSNSPHSSNISHCLALNSSNQYISGKSIQWRDGRNQTPHFIFLTAYFLASLILLLLSEVLFRILFQLVYIILWLLFIHLSHLLFFYFFFPR